MSDVFPFTIGLPYSLIRKFREADSGTWFEADLRVTSISNADVMVYGMFDNIWGGRGEKLREVPIVGIADELKPYILDRIKTIAEREIDRQDAEARKSRISQEAARIAETLEATP